MKAQKLIDRFKKSNRRISEEMQLDNLDYAKLVYNSDGEVVVENEHGSKFPVSDLSDSEMRLFYQVCTPLKQKVIFRTVFTVEVLSEYPIDNQMSLTDIANEGETGSFSIATKDKVVNQKIKGIKAVEAMRAQGSHEGFFSMDANGFDIED